MAAASISLVRGLVKRQRAHICASVVFLSLGGLILFGAKSAHFQPMDGQTTQDDTDALLTWFAFGVCIFSASIATCSLSDEPEKMGACVAFGLVAAANCYLSFMVYQREGQGGAGAIKAGLVTSSFIMALCGWGLPTFVEIRWQHALGLTGGVLATAVLLALRVIGPDVLLGIATALGLVVAMAMPARSERARARARITRHSSPDRPPPALPVITCRQQCCCHCRGQHFRASAPCRVACPTPAGRHGQRRQERPLCQGCHGVFSEGEAPLTTSMTSLCIPTSWEPQGQEQARSQECTI